MKIKVRLNNDQVTELLMSIIGDQLDCSDDKILSGTPIVENQSVMYDEPDYVFKGYEFEVDL